MTDVGYDYNRLFYETLGAMHFGYTYIISNSKVIVFKDSKQLKLKFDSIPAALSYLSNIVGLNNLEILNQVGTRKFNEIHGGCNEKN